MDEDFYKREHEYDKEFISKQKEEISKLKQNNAALGIVVFFLALFFIVCLYSLILFQGKINSLVEERDYYQELYENEQP